MTIEVLQQEDGRWAVKITDEAHPEGYIYGTCKHRYDADLAYNVIRKHGTEAYEAWALTR